MKNFNANHQPNFQETTESCGDDYYNTQEPVKDTMKFLRISTLSICTIIPLVLFLNAISVIGPILASLFGLIVLLPPWLIVKRVLDEVTPDNTGEMEERFRKNITKKYLITQIEGHLDPRIMHQQDITFYCGTEKFKSKVSQKLKSCEPLLNLEIIPLRE